MDTESEAVEYFRSCLKTGHTLNRHEIINAKPPYGNAPRQIIVFHVDTPNGKSVSVRYNYRKFIAEMP